MCLKFLDTKESWSEMTNPLKIVLSTFYQDSSAPDEDSCSECSQNSVTVIEHDSFLTALRVEYVKQQILKKLRLSKPPDVSISLLSLPKPLVNGHVIEFRPGEPYESENPGDSFFGKTNQVVIFPNSEKCSHFSNYPIDVGTTVCFTFNLNEEIEYVNVTGAEFWFHKKYDENDQFNQTFIISEIDHWDQTGSFEKYTIMAILETTIREGWVKTDVGYVVSQWIEKRMKSHFVQIDCDTCATKRKSAPVSGIHDLEHTLKPFIVIHTMSLPHKTRSRRYSDCLPGMKECCRDKLYINFASIGWSDWILHPSGYHAYFCRGSCSSAGSLTSASLYNNVIRRLLTKEKNGMRRRNEIIPCCSPTQLSTIQLLYIDSNNSITQKTLPNMVVEACGCL